MKKVLRPLTLAVPLALCPSPCQADLMIMADAWTTLEWGAWTLIAIMALGWIWGCRDHASRGGLNQITLTQTMFLFALAAIFPFTGWNKLHILWAAPVAIVSVYILILIPVVSRILGISTFLFGLIICGKTLKNRLAAESERAPSGPEYEKQSSEKSSQREMPSQGSSLAGAASQFDEIRGSPNSAQEMGSDEFLLQSGIDSLTLAASRRDVESGNTDTMLRSLRKLLAPKVAMRFRNRVALGIHGYDDDPRELAEIPEVRDWMSKLDRSFPYWLFYLDMHNPCFSFVVLSLCECDITSDNIRVDDRSIDRFIDEHLVAMRQICAQSGCSKEQSEAMTKEVLRLLGAT